MRRFDSIFSFFLTENFVRKLARKGLSLEAEVRKSKNSIRSAPRLDSRATNRDFSHFLTPYWEVRMRKTFIGKVRELRPSFAKF
jgi:hypothetical protein